MNNQHPCQNFATMVAQRVHHYIFVMILFGIIGENPAELARIDAELPAPVDTGQSLKISVTIKVLSGQESKFVRFEHNYSPSWMRDKSINLPNMADNIAFQLVTAIKNKLDTVSNPKLVPVLPHEKQIPSAVRISV